MRRRALLSSLAVSSAALAGCQRLASDTQPTTTDDEPTTSLDDNGSNGDEPDGEWPEDLASVVALETQPRTLSLFSTSYRSPDGGEVAIEFTGTATADHPAQVRVVLENANDFSNVFRLPEHPPLEARPSFYPEAESWPGESEPPEAARDIYLAPLSDQSLPTAAPAVERDPSGVWRLAEKPTDQWLPTTKRLDPGESVSVDFAVVGAADGRGPFAELRRHRRIGHDQSLTLATWHTDHPGPAGESRFAGASFPGLPNRTEDGSRTDPQWFHEATGETPVYLRPQTEHDDLPKTFRFALVNHDTEPATGNPYYWGLYKLAEGRWHSLGPQAFPAGVGALAPGGAKTYTLRAANGEPLPCSDGQTAGFLGGGTYAFEAGMSVADETHAAVFEIDAPPVDVTPMEALEVSREDGVVVVTGPRWSESESRSIVTVTPADTAEALLIPEKAAREPVFRNTLPFFESGVQRVEYRTSRWRAGPARDADRYRFRGQPYAFTAEKASKN